MKKQKSVTIDRGIVMLEEGKCKILRRKKMGKLIKFVLVLFIAAILLFALAIPINDYEAKDTAKQLENIPLPKETKLIETVYKAGKLSGKRDAMEYFGAILIKSKQSLPYLIDYYKKHNKNCNVYIQTTQNLEEVKLEKLAFEKKVESDCYVVSCWGDTENSGFFSKIDYRVAVN